MTELGTVRSVQTALRVEAELMEKLVADASKRGCSVSAEIRRRLWESFGTSPEAVKYEKAWTE